MSAHRALAVAGLLALGACQCSGKEAAAPTSAPARPAVDPQERVRRGEPVVAPSIQLPPVPDTPLTDEDVASCKIDEDLVARASCLGALAQRHRDPRYCGAVAELAKAAGESAPPLVKSGAAANACRRTIAFMRDDPALCASIDQAAMAGSCLSYFAMKRRDPAVCDLGPGEAGMTCYLNEAARTRDASLCDKTGQFRDDCTKRLGPVGP